MIPCCAQEQDAIASDFRVANFGSSGQWENAHNLFDDRLAIDGPGIMNSVAQRKLESQCSLNDGNYWPISSKETGRKFFSKFVDHCHEKQRIERPFFKYIVDKRLFCENKKTVWQQCSPEKQFFSFVRIRVHCSYCIEVCSTLDVCNMFIISCTLFNKSQLAPSDTNSSCYVCPIQTIDNRFICKHNFCGARHGNINSKFDTIHIGSMAAATT